MEIKISKEFEVLINPSKLKRFWSYNKEKIVMTILAMSLLVVSEAVYDENYTKVLGMPRFAFGTDNNADNDSDIDTEGSIGVNDSSYLNAQAQDGVWQNLSEELQDYQQTGIAGKTSGSGFLMNKNADRVEMSYFNINNNRSIHNISFYGIGRDDALYNASAINITMGVYNSTRYWFAGGFGGGRWNYNPTDLLGTTEEITINNDSQQWWTASFSTPLFLEGSTLWKYFFTIHHEDRIKIKRSNLLQMGVNKSYDAIDAYSNGLEDPFGPASAWSGGAYFIKYGYNQTVQSYQLDWEHQSLDVHTGHDYYKICVYGYVSPTSEEFAVQVWDQDLQEWEDWGVGIYTQYWMINGTTPQWYNYSLFQNIYENITWRYTDNFEDTTTFYGDSVQHTLHIDYAGVFYYNISIDVQEIQINISSIINITWPTGTTYIGFDENPIQIDYISGVNFSIRVKGQNFPNPSCIWVSNTSDPETNGAVQPPVWGTGIVVFENMPLGSGTLDAWVWVKVEDSFSFSSMALQSASLTFYINAYS